ncbi:hypothetical protein B5M09_013732 [Aphanomyces astaci]|uniref:Peptidase S9A N-terminal domain-containing protein n=1 Tax=Aphanomyces astaci TaxID=112090 RepID=A0A425DA03_APHAT|nr:hypothetical protein B5M09_013732 [Aphanomyces astaci]
MVPYGKVPGENRGEQPMEPIIYLEDPYYYVRDDSRSNTEILDHLRAENAYTKAALSHLDGPQDELYKELLSHVQEATIWCRIPTATLCTTCARKKARRTTSTAASLVMMTAPRKFCLTSTNWRMATSSAASAASK